jgi:predicted glutamine amidotransferase
MKLATGEKAVVVALKPLTEEEPWVEVSNNHLLVVNRNLNIKLVEIC